MKSTGKASRRIPEEKAATQQEIVAAVEALTPEDLLRLRGFAKWRVAGMGRAAQGQDWEDLLGKAIAATYEGAASHEGGRRWNKDAVRFREHLLGAMRSISSHERDHFDEKEAMLESDLIYTSAAGEQVNPLATIESPGASPHRVLEAKEKAEEIEAIANENALAWLIWDGFKGGMNGPEIRDALSVSQKDYYTAMKWLRRKIRPRAKKDGE
ncbi:MAG: hypothetical protein QOH71_1704 [Blastocatellia bacterium]|jgi:hypothetical protein|nr:hypothetical protein [Blastocatellia bacterium]